VPRAVATEGFTVAHTGRLSHTVSGRCPERGIDRRRHPTASKWSRAVRAVAIVAGQTERLELRRFRQTGKWIARKYDRGAGVGGIVSILEPYLALLMLTHIVADGAVRVGNTGGLNVMRGQAEFAEDGPPRPLGRGVARNARAVAVLDEARVVLVASRAIGALVVDRSAAVVLVMEGRGVANLAHAVVGSHPIAETSRSACGRKDNRLVHPKRLVENRRPHQRQISVRSLMDRVTFRACRLPRTSRSVDREPGDSAVASGAERYKWSGVGANRERSGVVVWVCPKSDCAFLMLALVMALDTIGRA